MSEMTRRGFVKGAALAPLALGPLSGVAQQGATAEKFDVVVAGAGHNSLICAAYLAKAGYRVLVLEGRPTIGGGCKTAEVCLRGFKEDLCSTVHGGIQSNPLLRDNELKLRDYGLEYIDPDPVMHTQFTDGGSLSIWRDLDRTVEEYARISKKDAETFRRLSAEYKAYTQATAASRAGDKNAKIPMSGVWQRRQAMSGYELVKELFVDERIQGFHLAVGHFGGVPGGDPGTGAQAWSIVAQQITGRPIPKGGSGMLTVALGRFLEAHNAVILTNKPVTELMIESGKCVGVRCADGYLFAWGMGKSSRWVVSSSRKFVISGLAGAGVFLALLSAAWTLPAQQAAPPAAAKQLVPDNYGEHPAPTQPVPFRHKLHLSVGLQCKTCHTNPDPGKLMTFPATSTCMSCHRSVARNTPAIRQLAEFAKSTKPIPWVRVYVLTPGVTWTHRKHLEAGLQCENCHGQVAQMDAMSEATSVTAMGACIQCHGENKAATTCQTCHAWPSK